MSSAHTPRAPRRKKTGAGYLVHIYRPEAGGCIYVPIIPAWGATGLKRTLDNVCTSAAERRLDPGLEAR